MELHVISTGRQKPDQWIPIVLSIHQEIDFFHLREKQATARELLMWVDMLLEQGVPREKLIINDRVDVAAARGLAVQLAWHSLPPLEVRRLYPDMRVGVSVHSSTEAKNAEKNGADFIVFGHLFSTSSKPGLAPRGTDELRTISEPMSVPVIGIGGVTPDNVSLVHSNGAYGAAVLSGVMEATDPVEAVRSYRKEWMK